MPATVRMEGEHMVVSYHPRFYLSSRLIGLEDDIHAVVWLYLSDTSISDSGPTAQLSFSPTICPRFTATCHFL